MDDIALRTEVERLRAENGELRRAADDAHAGRLTAEVERNAYLRTVERLRGASSAAVGVLAHGDTGDAAFAILTEALALDG